MITKRGKIKCNMCGKYLTEDTAIKVEKTVCGVSEPVEHYCFKDFKELYADEEQSK